MRSSRVLPPENELRELLATVRWTEIAQRYGILPSSVHHAAARINFGRQPKHLLAKEGRRGGTNGGRRSRVPTGEVLRDMVQTIPVHMIAAQYKVDNEAVYHQLRRIGVSGQRPALHKTKLSGLDREWLSNALKTTNWSVLAEGLKTFAPDLACQEAGLRTPADAPQEGDEKGNGSHGDAGLLASGGAAMIGFYVNVLSQNWNLLLRGPFDTYEEAEAAIPATSRQAQKYDPWLHFGVWGVARMEAPRLIQGRLDFLESMRSDS